MKLKSKFKVLKLNCCQFFFEDKTSSNFKKNVKIKKDIYFEEYHELHLLLGK